MLTIQSDNGKQGYKIGGKKYRRPKVVLSQRPLRTVLQRLDSETRGILGSQREREKRKIKGTVTGKRHKKLEGLTLPTPDVTCLHLRNLLSWLLCTNKHLTSLKVENLRVSFPYFSSRDKRTTNESPAT